MSTILKALRRLEEERERAASRPLREDVVLRRSPVRHRAVWFAVAAAGALAFAAAFAASRWPKVEPEGAPQALAVAAAPAVARAPAPAPAPRAPLQALPPPPARPPPAAVGTAPPAPEAIAPAAAERPAVPDVALVRPLPARVPRIADEPAAKVVRPSLSTQREPAPASARGAVAIRVVRTSWHPLPARRAAWVEWGAEGVREVREGARVGSYRVREIEPDAVLFSDGAALLREPIGGR